MDTEIRCLTQQESKMARRQYTREFKLEAVRLIKERGVSVTQAARDLDVGEGVCCVAGPGRFRGIRSIRFLARGR